MDVERAREIYDNVEFNDELPQEHDFLEGIEILKKYHSKDSKYDYQFEHDQMWFMDFEPSVTKMTEVEVIKMFELGWFEDEDSWSLLS